MSNLEYYLSNYFEIENSKKLNLSQLFKEEHYSKNEFYCQVNGSCNKMSFIESGAFRISCQTEKKDVTQWISTTGEFTTDLSSLLFNTPSRWTIQALTDSKIHTISSVNYNIIKDEEPNWPQIEKLFLSKCFVTLENRTFSLLSMTAEERYSHFIESKEELFNIVPHHYIASMLNMTPETLSRIRKKLIP